MPLPLLPSLRWHHCDAVIIADITLAPLGHCCRRGAGVITDVALASLPLLPSRRWHHCGRCPGTAWASLPSRCWRHCGLCPGAIAIVAIMALASLRRWHHCEPCPGAVWASLLSWRWRHCGCYPGTIAIVAVAVLASLQCAGVIAAIALALLGHCRLCGAGVIADVALRRCHHCCRGAGLIAALASLRPLPWRRLGIVAVTALASLWTSLWRRCHCCRRGAGIIAALASYDSAANKDVVGECRCARAAAVERGFDTAFDTMSPTHASSSSIVRGAGVGTPLTAKSLALAEGASTKSLAAFPGVVWPTLRGLDVINDVPSLENLSSLSKGITSGPFAPAVAIAVARQGGFVPRLTPSRFKET
jgi:hypothetical protein